MYINDLLQQKKMTKYRLSKISGVPFTTISEITTGKTKIKNCTGDTLYRLAKSLEVSIEDLLAESMEYRQSFEAFKSSICHRVKDMGDLDFIIGTLESDKIRELYNKHWYLESLYLLAMIDFLCRENDIPVCTNYNDLRKMKFSKPIYPVGVIVMSSCLGNDNIKYDSIRNAIPEFIRFNIVENEVRNVV